MRVSCVHLLDDFSGSAKVFAHAIDVIAQAGAEVRVTVGSAGTGGFIRRTHRVRTVFYRFRDNKLLLLLYFALAQAQLFFTVVGHCLFWRADIVYANTVLAPGAVIAGRLCRRRVVVHMHEVGLGTPALFRVLLAVARRADTRICVSAFVRGALHLEPRTSPVVHNSLAPDEWRRAAKIVAARHEPPRPFVALMACSLKWYKGIDSFIALAHAVRAQRVEFRLLLNCTSAEWSAFALGLTVPPNVRIELRPADIYRHYGDASLVLNLSHPEGWIETFGLTLLEAMACGVPVVSPRVGGCVELFEHGSGGWHIGSRDIPALETLLLDLAGEPERWRRASSAARANAARFGEDGFARELRSAVLGESSPR